jgi:hypothetical protein
MADPSTKMLVDKKCIAGCQQSNNRAEDVNSGRCPSQEISQPRSEFVVGLVRRLRIISTPPRPGMPSVRGSGISAPM